MIAVAGTLTLAAVFLVAAVAKFADVRAAQGAVEEFGVPRAVAVPVGSLLPVVELAVVVLLLVPSTALGGAVAAGMLLLLFTVAIVVNLARIRSPDCNCFGQVGSAPVDRSTLVRNGGLLGIAVVTAVALAADPGSSPAHLLDDVDAAAGALTVAGLALVAAGVAGWGIFHVLRGHGRLLLRIDQLEAALTAAGIAVPSVDPVAIGIPAGSPAPPFTASDVTGRPVTRDELLAGASRCCWCSPTPAAGLVTIWCRRSLAGSETTPTTSRSPSRRRVRPRRSVPLLLSTASPNVLLDEREQLFAAHGARATPSAILISADAHVAAPLATGLDEIRELRARAVAGAMRLIHHGGDG